MESINKSAADFTEDFLAHYGKKGMRWGVSSGSRESARIGKTAKKLVKRGTPDKAIERRMTLAKALAGTPRGRAKADARATMLVSAIQKERAAQTKK